MDSAPSLQQRLHDIQKELLTLTLGVGVLALLNVTGLIPWLLESEAAWIIAGLLFLGGVVVLLSQQAAGAGNDDITHRPWQAAGLLLASLAVVVMIAESMGQLIEQGVNELSLPAGLAGILVAMLILIPEVLNAIQATRRGQLQRALNTLFGYVLATISLTVPAVLVIGEITGTEVILGLDPAAVVLLALTLFLLRPHPKVLGSEGLMLLVVFLFWLVFELV